MSGTTPLKFSPPTECSWHLSNAFGFGDPRRLQSAIGKLHFAVLFGGIAQLVERQLCKLEVRGSNPLASSPESFRGCRAVAWRRRTSFRLASFFARATTRQASHDKILLCLYAPERSRISEVLTGVTNDSRTRLKAHNCGRIIHTAKWKPWRLKTYIALSDRTRAAQLERYLKSASGRAFIKSRLERFRS